MPASGVEVARHGSTLVVQMVRESKRNAINGPMTLAIDAALTELEADPQLRVGVITGTSVVFSAGTDMYDPGDKTTPLGGEYGVIRRVRRKPLIAAVEGPAVGGGFEIVMSCDLVVAAETASFALPETRRGLVATSGALFRGPRALPRNIAVELLLAGSSLNATRAYQFGFVNRVVPHGEALSGALELASEICLSAPDAVGATLTALDAVHRECESRGWVVTAEVKSTILASPESVEGRLAFAERRMPRWAES
jgi:enoyl-CoA hydratase